MIVSWIGGRGLVPGAGMRTSSARGEEESGERAQASEAEGNVRVFRLVFGNGF